MDLRSISNQRLYEEWTDSLESAAVDPGNGYARRREDQCMEEIIRRIKEAGRRPLQSQEA